jgi:hypothetical protein
MTQAFGIGEGNGASSDGHQGILSCSPCVRLCSLPGEGAGGGAAPLLIVRLPQGDLSPIKP